MLILQENVPSYLCPAVNSKSIVLYYRCKLLPEGIEIEGLDFSSSRTRVHNWVYQESSPITQRLQSLRSRSLHPSS
jgi:hypothetical protein